VFLLDIGLPGMDGLTLAAKLRDLPQVAGATLVAVTGYNQPDDKEKSRSAGFDHHLAKPVDTGELLAILSGVAQLACRSGLPP
jgi:CheY-like chemotaxis protein